MTECTECGKKIPAGQVHQINDYAFCERCCGKLIQERKPPDLYQPVYRPDGTVCGTRKVKEAE